MSLQYVNEWWIAFYLQSMYYILYFKVKRNRNEALV